MKPVIAFCLFFIIAGTILQAQENPKEYYQDQVHPGEKLLDAFYQGIFVKTADGRFESRIYYPEKKVLTHLVNYSDKKRNEKNGPYKEWYDNGQPWKEGSYENGQEEGLWNFYNSSGKRIEYGNYTDGKKEGLWYQLDSLGGISVEMNFRAGKLEGEWKKLDDQGKTVLLRQYKNGEMTSERSFETTGSDGRMALPEVMPHLKSCANEDLEVQKACSERAMLESIYSQIRYPAKARDNGVMGTAIISFVVEKDGTLSNFNVLRGICADIEAECLRVLGNMPEWNPGIQNGVPVRVVFNLPIRFKLE